MPDAEVTFKVDAFAVVAKITQVAFEYADMMPVNTFHLADLGNINIKVCNVAGVWREVGGVAGNAIIESRPYSNEKITVLYCVVCGRDPVHAEHMQSERVRCITRAECH